MFNAVSWNQFLYAAALIIGGYYAITTLLLYHREIIALFRGQRIAPRKNAEVATASTQHREGWMGVAEVEVASVSTTSSEDLKVGADDEQPEVIAAAQPAPVREGLIVGSVADLLQEVKTLIVLVAEYKSSREEAESMFRNLLQRYPQLKHTYYRASISEFIAETARTEFTFSLATDEVSSWWDEAIATLIK